MAEHEVGTEALDAFYSQALHNEWARILSTPGGRFVVWSILEKCHIFATTYTGNAHTNFLEGERSVGLKILKEHVFPVSTEALSEMMAEAQERADRFERAIEQEQENDDG